MRFFCNKHAILFLQSGFRSVGYAHNSTDHAKEIGVVFGWFNPENDKEPRTPTARS